METSGDRSLASRNAELPGAPIARPESSDRPHPSAQKIGTSRGALIPAVVTVVRRSTVEFGSHADPLRRIEAVGCLPGPNRTEFETDLVFGQLSEAKVTIEGSVPWDLYECREGDR